MTVMAVHRFERFFRAAAGLDVDTWSHPDDVRAAGVHRAHRHLVAVLTP